jgi:hypothetical protein
MVLRRALREVAEFQVFRALFDVLLRRRTRVVVLLSFGARMKETIQTDSARYSIALHGPST